MSSENFWIITKSQRPYFKRQGSTNKNYYFEYIKNFKELPLNIQSYLIDQIYSIYSISIKGHSKESFVEIELSDPKSLSLKILLLKSISDNSIQGFAEMNIFEFFALPNDFSNSNRYLVSAGIMCVNPNFRCKGMLKDVNNVYPSLIYEEYKDSNLLVVDICINPISYFVLCKKAKFLVPDYKRTYSKAMEDFAKKVMISFGYCGLENKSPFVTKEGIGDFAKKVMISFGYCGLENKSPFVTKEGSSPTGFDKYTYLENYNTLPQEMQYYINLTDLEDNIGVCVLMAFQTIQGNTLCISCIECDKQEKFSYLIYDWIIDYLNPKI
ncbi:hypothetical protein SteCoe_19907 [Stentor coeruleus]|uniref:Uncharacterized protein n=1 Tax=Stentor coeruleus TaxID=5963 RepID=A0A1R2BT81_9CILI|nr:hypothetical protein SteCoe_19907 [Stentor coeruleus]